MSYFFSFPYRLDYNFENNRTVQNKINTNQFINVPVNDYHFDRLLILIMSVFHLSFVDIQKN